MRIFLEDPVWRMDLYHEDFVMRILFIRILS